MSRPLAECTDRDLMFALYMTASTAADWMMGEAAAEIETDVLRIDAHEDAQVITATLGDVLAEVALRLGFTDDGNGNLSFEVRQ